MSQEKSEGPSGRRQRQAAQTRREILEAARRLFVERGYGATTIADVAAAADVAVQTIYSSVGSKAELLIGLLDLARDTAEVPEADAGLETFTDPFDLPRAGAKLQRQLMETSGDVLRLLAETAPFDDEVRQVWETAMVNSRAGIAVAVRRLADLNALAPWFDTETASDVTFVVGHLRVYMELLDLGWSHDRIEEWMRLALARLLIDPAVIGE